MNFEWDDKKAQKNLKEHGVSFEKVTVLFLNNKRLISVDRRNDYGEERFITLGMVEKRLHVVVYTERGGSIRIISARKANKKEQKRYGNY